MELYFSPLACSMATRIACYEAGLPASYVQVDTKTNKTRDGRDFLAMNPLGLVPALRTDAGDYLTENAAILQYVAGLSPAGKLSPADEWGQSRLRQWLCFIGTELHKALFAPLLDHKAPAEAKSYAMAKGARALEVLDAHLGSREFLLDDFTVADAYLGTVLAWAVVTPLRFTAYPAIERYVKRIHARPSVARAIEEERALYMQEKAREAAVAANVS